MWKTAIWKKNYKAKVFECDQLDYSNKAMLDEKAQQCPSWTKLLANATITIVFRDPDVILAIPLEFSLSLAIP